MHFILEFSVTLIVSASLAVLIKGDPQPQRSNRRGENVQQFIYPSRVSRSNGELTNSIYSREQEQVNPFIHLSTPELISRHGFPVESHTVITEDDYVLTLYRIPHGRFNGNSSTKPKPIFLQHGLFSQSADWLINTVNKALPYKLADEGYDVWLGNARGTADSNKHVRFSTKKSRYWDYSWHEMGIYDLPAVIDHILNKTGEPNLYYVGHSMGTTMYFVMASMKPEYNKKIRLMVALGPSAYLDHMKGPLKYLYPFASYEKSFLDILGNGKLLPDFLLKYLHKYAPAFCDPANKISIVCENLIFAIGGFDIAQANLSTIPVVVSNTPSETSTKTVIHYLQVIGSKKFQQYDYGVVKNLKIYNRITPPQYNFQAISSPVALFWADNDVLCVPEDVARLAAQLPNLVLNFEVPFKQFSHIDFVFAIDADTLVYNPILELLKKF